LNAIHGAFPIAFRPVISHFRDRISVEIRLDVWQVDG
jgi:hypothetical protein